MTRWIRAVLRWISEPRIFWLCVFVMGIFMLLALSGRVSELKIRIIGLILQIFGIATVVWGLKETRDLFGHPSAFDFFVAWLKRFPRFRPESVSIDAQIVLPTLKGSLSGYAWQSFGPDAPIEKRLSAVEANLLDVNRRLEEAQRRIDHRIKKGTSELNEEKIRRKEEDEKTRQKLQLSQTGGLSITAMGLGWLVSGIIMSTASAEIAKLFM